MIKVTEPYTPIQYLMGSTEFCSLNIKVNEDVLIPRPETELLVETAVEFLTSHDSRSSAEPARRAGGASPKGAIHDPRILDLCTGSGCIAVALKVRLTKKLLDCKIVASDISEKALALAWENAKTHRAEQIEFIKSDLFNDLKGRFDLVVSNPPYISGLEFAQLQEEVLKEPRVALYGGEDGLDFYRRIFNDAGKFLNDGGYVVVEIGYGQSGAVKDICEGVLGFKMVDIKKDLSGIDRVIVARWTN